jgi:hypothetical protein
MNDRYTCGLCGGHFYGAHYCTGHQPPLGTGAFTPTPITEERVREIVREELAKATPGRPTGVTGPG